VPTAGHVGDADLARINLAVFTPDAWVGGLGAPFFGALLRAPNARWLHMFAAGTDNPVFAQLMRQGVRLTNSAGSSATPIAHTVIMHTIALCRDARTFAIAQHEHRWAERNAVDVEGRTMGIVGLGSIGSEVARLAQHFGIRVIGMRRTPRGDEPCETWPTSRLHELLPLVDDLVLTAPLTDETHEIISARELALLRPGAHLVNIGRGQLIDEPALIAALQSGHLGGAALDVTDPEPLPMEHPLYSFANVIITPHIASASTQTRGRMAEFAAKNIIAVLKGETPSTPVNRPANPR